MVKCVKIIRRSSLPNNEWSGALTPIIMYFLHEVHDINTLQEACRSGHFIFETSGWVIAFTSRGFTLKLVSRVQYYLITQLHPLLHANTKLNIIKLLRNNSYLTLVHEIKYAVDLITTYKSQESDFSFLWE